MQKVLIELKNITKKFDDDVIVDNLNLKIYENEFLTLLGPSGCGKSTTIRMIAGFESPNAGQIIIDGKVINDLPPYVRPINTVFQRYALFPHLNVFDNVAFGLRNRNLEFLLKFFNEEQIIDEVKETKKARGQAEPYKITKRDLRKVINGKISAAVEKALALVKLKGYESRKVNQLSGGQQQRVALARALVNRPKILLLDEPLAALDLKLRQNMQYELKEMQRTLGITFVFVTHDQEEAMTMSDRIVVMKDGVIQQLGTPKDIYNEPVNRYVATFIGESNIIPGVYLKKNLVKFMAVEFACMGYTFADNENVDVVIRPEDFDVVPLDQAKLTGVVTSAIFKGVHNELCINIQGVEFVVNTYENYEVGQPIGLKVDPYEIHLMKVESNE
ncbi:MAG TPA: ABC transporter ATP-binding protein [Bacilli bacterium]|nr:MAG: Spermidine/putrescine import ATP-binding protein PotA [Tenericutes bacterium ADurb.BinA124]HNZ50410.1 ABC transporter ATP-binding protein [Bacilli bacterium]HPX83848.1 ABC transporter ATP-binding protein [Bacilli bacterium]HQC74626.1 ABC transporter ATP-binding protein [Bacilli bacterium]